MHTAIELPAFEFESEERQAAVIIMGELALRGIRNRYRKLPYHNERHAIDVAVAVDKIARDAKATERQRTNLIIGGFWHDYYQGHQAEARSANAAMRTMDERNLLKGRDRLDVGRFIKGTEVAIVDSAITQAAEWKLEKMLADADLAAFGQEPDIFWSRSLDLYRERNAGELPQGDELRDYAASQADTLEKHEFMTEAATRVFPFKHLNIAYMHELSQEDQAA